MVVRISDNDSFAIDTCAAFGLASASGVYGMVGDTAAEIFRHCGIGPLSKWVDNHLFIQLRREALPAYNLCRAQWASEITSHGGRQHSGGRLWFKGAPMLEQFDEDASKPLLDLTSTSPRSPHDALFAYCMADIDDISHELGIPWEKEKDVPVMEWH